MNAPRGYGHATLPARVTPGIKHFDRNLIQKTCRKCGKKYETRSRTQKDCDLCREAK